MKQLQCPVNGVRPLQEFTYGGEYREMPDPDACSDAEWANYVFNRNNSPQSKLEWWYHNASGVWFMAERHTGTDEVLRTGMYADMIAKGND